MTDVVSTPLEQLVTDIKYVLEELNNKAKDSMTVLDAAQIVEQANRVIILNDGQQIVNYKESN